MILSINPKTKKTEIVSIPRDTRAEIVGRGTTEKSYYANHPYRLSHNDQLAHSSIFQVI
jgi:anionic cell wall polymer biosynthesis LytR-Cps2A-Psr (LCP) family protein